MKVYTSLFQRTARPVWYKVGMIEGKSGSDEMEGSVGLGKDFDSHF